MLRQDCFHSSERSRKTAINVLPVEPDLTLVVGADDYDPPSLRWPEGPVVALDGSAGKRSLLSRADRKELQISFVTTADED